MPVEHGALAVASGSQARRALVTVRDPLLNQAPSGAQASDDEVARGAAEREAVFLTTLVAGLQAGERGARATLFDRYAAHVLRVLSRILGGDPELADLTQDVFTAAFTGIDRLRDPKALSGWLSQIAVFTARNHIRRKKRARLIAFFGFDSVPEVAAREVPREVNDALRALYDVLAQMSADQRIAFALRYVEGMELTEVASACGVSLATVKRRLAAAQARLVELAQTEPALLEWLEDRR